MIIDCKAYEIAVSFDSIELFAENKDDKINIVYYVPSNEKGELLKRNEVYECAENELIMKTYKSIKSTIDLKEAKASY